MLAIYCRVSKDTPGKQSIPFQKEVGEKFAKENDLLYDFYVDEGRSGGGKAGDRPDYSRMLSDIENGKIKAVFFYDQDRLAREEKIWFELADVILDNGIDLYDISGLIDLNDENVFQFRAFKSVMDASYKRRIGANLKRITERNVKRGVWKGIYPYGYKRGDDGKLEIDEEEAEIVKRIYALSLQGLGCRKIAQIFNDEEIPTRYQKIAKKGGRPTYVAVNTPRGKRKEVRKKSEAKWRDKTVRDSIKNTLYKGVRKYNGENYTNVPKIFEPAYWKKVNDHLKQNRNTKHGNAKKYNYLLRGLLICGRCGRNYHGRVNVKDNYYMCTSKRFPKENCGNRAINRPFIEEFVWSKFFLSGEFDKHLEEYFEEQGDKAKLKVLDAKIHRFNKQIKQFDKDALNAQKQLIKNRFSEEEYDFLIADIKKEKSEIIERLSKAKEERSALENIDKTKTEILGDLKHKQILADLPFEKIQEFISKYLDYIEVDYINVVYFLRFHFKLSNMRPQLFYVERHYAYGFNITDQPLGEYEVDWNLVVNTTIMNVASPRWEKFAPEKVGKEFKYRLHARNDYLEAKGE